MGADNPPAEGGDVFGEYLRAKAGADRALIESGLDYTIIRPGSLTDDPPTGLVAIAADFQRARSPAPTSPRPSLPPPRRQHDRQDLRAPTGDTPIEEAVAGLCLRSTPPPIRGAMNLSKPEQDRKGRLKVSKDRSCG